MKYSFCDIWNKLVSLFCPAEDVKFKALLIDLYSCHILQTAANKIALDVCAE